MKRIISFKQSLGVLLVAVLTFFCADKVYNNQPNNSTNTEQESVAIEKQFPNINVQDLSMNDVDKSKAIVINSEQEYYQFLKDLSQQNETTVEVPLETISILTEDSSTYNNIISCGYKNGGKYTSKTASSWIGSLGGTPPVKMNMCFDFTVKKVGRDYKFNKISNKKCWLSGLQFPVAYKWHKKSFTYNLSSDKTVAYFTLKGSIDMTVIYKDLPKLYTSNHVFKFRYGISSAAE